MQNKKNRLKFFVVIILTFFILTGFVYLLILNTQESDSSYFNSIANIEKVEKNNPADFLSLKVNYKASFWGSKLILNCTLTNSASMVTYKDVIIRVTYFSKTRTELGVKDYTVYELFKPNSTQKFVVEAENYKDVSFIETSVFGASNY